MIEIEALSSDDRQPVGLDPGKLREIKPAAYLVRFNFGAGVAVLAGVVGLAFGPWAGGLFLAFPALLPASLTLIEKEGGSHPCPRRRGRWLPGGGRSFCVRLVRAAS